MFPRFIYVLIYGGEQFELSAIKLTICTLDHRERL